MSGHTPGPWETENDCASVFSSGALHLGERYMVASVYGDDAECKPDAAMRANARLIAAAPELLASLRIFTDFPADVFEGEEDGPYTMTVRLADMRRARAAIAKAEGKA